MIVGTRERSDRLGRMIELFNDEFAKADWLADQLNVSPRTVYRDIGFLKACGYPICGEAGVGYMLRRREARHVD